MAKISDHQKYLVVLEIKVEHEPGFLVSLNMKFSSVLQTMIAKSTKCSVLVFWYRVGGVDLEFVSLARAGRVLR